MDTCVLCGGENRRSAPGDSQVSADLCYACCLTINNHGVVLDTDKERSEFRGALAVFIDRETSRIFLGRPHEKKTAPAGAVVYALPATTPDDEKSG